MSSTNFSQGDIRDKDSANAEPPGAPDMRGLTDAHAWATSIDTYMREHELDAGSIMSWGYANGHIGGIELLPEHELTTDDNLVGENPHDPDEVWVIEYKPQSGFWVADE